MSNVERQEHWQGVYGSKAETEVSWFQQRPSISLELIKAARCNRHDPIIDIGGGASRLVDTLLDAGHDAITVLDLSAKALETSKRRLGARAKQVEWVVSDVTRWEPAQQYAIWHDRAAFHFLTELADRAAYADRLARALRPGGEAIIGTFALDGPAQCSGLPVVRYDAASLGQTLGPAFALFETRADDHRTPSGSIQKFQFSRFRKNS
jgi:ubiquinone/menaquinone biosynthesis C-methylase UbiE